MRNTSFQNYRLNALAVALVLGFGASAVQAQDASSALESWRDYAESAMTPAYAWAQQQRVAAPSVLDASVEQEAQSAEYAHLNLFGADATLSVAAASYSAADTPFAVDNASNAELAQLRPGLSRSIVAPTLQVALGSRSRLLAGAVLARQQFASLGLGEQELQSPSVSLRDQGLNEQVAGAGVRLGLATALTDKVEFVTSYRSKVNMDAFQRYRGLFSEPGDFDLPAVTSAGFNWRIVPRVALGLEASRIAYSDVSAFTSRALPERFTSLLGDGGSPVFAWRDLDVMSATVRVAGTERDDFSLRYTTRQQPTPTSGLLGQVLSSGYTHNNWWFAWQHQAERIGSLRLAASYAPQTYFLGNLSSSDRNASGTQVEVEATWSLNF